MDIQLVRNITNIGDLRKCQSFVVHVDRRRLLRHQTVKEFLRPMLDFLFICILRRLLLV